MTYEDVTWSNTTAHNNGFSINGNAVTPTHTSAAWDNYIRSDDEWVHTEGYPSLKFTVSDADSLNCGLAYDPLTSSNNTFSAIEYGVQINDIGTAYAYTGGSSNDVLKTNCTSSDVFEVIVTQTAIIWKVNNVQEHSISTTHSSSTVWYVQTTVKSVGTTVYAQADPISTVASFGISVLFYETNNLRNEQTGSSSSTTSGWKHWIGMRGKKRYGNNHIKRIRL